VREEAGAARDAWSEGSNPPGEAWSRIVDDPVELVAREIQMRGATVPAVLFLEANRAYGPLGGQAMLFFDPVIHRVFGGDLADATRLLADENGIERLIERLEELHDEVGLDA
jgi:hypothetical protein